MAIDIIFKGSTLEEVAQFFGNLIAREYENLLEFWKISAEEYETTEYWDTRIQWEAPVVGENARKKLLRIMKGEDQETEKYRMRRKLFGRLPNVICITSELGFFDNLSERNFEQEWNWYSSRIRYIIDTEKFIIAREWSFEEYTSRKSTKFTQLE